MPYYTNTLTIEDDSPVIEQKMDSFSEFHALNPTKFTFSKKYSVRYEYDPVEDNGMTPFMMFNGVVYNLTMFFENAETVEGTAVVGISVEYGKHITVNNISTGELIESLEVEWLEDNSLILSAYI